MARKFTEITTIGLHYHEIEVEMKDGKETKKVRYERIKSPESLAKLFTSDSLSKEQQEVVWEHYCYGVDLAARAAEREANVPETTKVKVKGKEIDLLAFPLDKFIPAYNAKVAAVAAEQALNPDAKLPIAFATTAKRHCESGKAFLKDGKLYPKK